MKSVLKRFLAVLTVVCLVVSCSVLAVGVSAAEALTVSVESKEVQRGETVDVSVSITSNPGITILKLYVEYDTSVLELVNVTDTKLLAEGTMDSGLQSPYEMIWLDATATTNSTATGAIAKMQFKVASDAANGTEAVIKVYTTTKNDVLNADLAPVTFAGVNGKLTVVDKLADIMPSVSVAEPMASIRLEDKEADPYVSAGLRFRGTLTDAQMANATEIGFVAAPYNAVKSDNDWYMFDAGGALNNSIAKATVCYDSASGKDVVYSEGDGNKSYQLILTNLSNENGQTHYDLEICAVMYVKTADGYTYYKIASATYQQVYDYYVANGMI